jgi:hypothetical protein
MCDSARDDGLEKRLPIATPRSEVKTAFYGNLLASRARK